MALCEVGQVPSATFAGVRLGSWALGFAAALLVAAFQARRGRVSLWTAAGVGLVSVPAWTALLATLPDMVRTFCAEGNLNLVIVPGQVLPPESRYDLSGQYIGSILGQLGYVGAGALLLWRGRDPAGWRNPTIARIAASLRGLLPMGRGETLSLLLGVALFPVLAAANLLLAWLTAGSGVRTGDDSRVFENITALQIVLLALAAGVGEELVYRGVMQQGLKRLLPRSRWGGLALGLGVQAVVFAYAHAGYQNLEHLLFAFLFALLAGVVAETLGLWTAIALHVLVDLYAFGLAAAESAPWMVSALGALFLANLAFTVAWAIAALRRRLLLRGGSGA